MNVSSNGENEHTRTSATRAPRRPLYVTVTSVQGESLDLSVLWRTLLDSRWLLLGIMMLFGAGAVWYSFAAQELFRAEAVLAPASADPQQNVQGLGGLASLAGIRLGAGSDRAETVAIFRSKKFIADFIGSKNLLPVLFHDQWDAGASRWTQTDPSEQPDIRDATEYFLGDVVSITEDGDTGFVTLAIEWTDPALAAQWVAELVERANETKRQRDIAESQQKLDYLNAQLTAAPLLELRQAISRVIEEQVSAMTIAQAQREYAFRIIDPAIVPKRRVWPQPTLIVIAALGLGGLVGAFVVLLRLGFVRESPRSGTAS